MANIIGIAGKKQSGKNTMANYLHGEKLKKLGVINDFSINGSGQLVISTSVGGDDELGILDVTRKDTAFVEYAHYNIWPYIKLYSFADGLKNLCIDFFGLRTEQVYGTDKQKNTKSNIKWENLPSRKKGDKSKGYMTSRELLQYFGTDVMRQMSENVWVDHALKSIVGEQSELAIIADVRFPNEVDAIKAAGGKVIRLTREYEKDQHESESALDKDNYDWDNFDFIIDNSRGGTPEFCEDISKLFNKMEVAC
jgi:hypothetical protein